EIHSGRDERALTPKTIGILIYPPMPLLVERKVARRATLCVSPTRALADKLKSRWSLESERVHLCPNVFHANSNLLSVMPDPDSQLITYLGRLELRKGLVELATALPIIFQTIPKAKIQFIGQALPSPVPGMLMDAWLKEVLRPWNDRLQFVGHIDRNLLPEFFSQSGITVLPSRWENFPNTCLEAMSAGQAVIGSRHGGMAEIIKDGFNGRLIDPYDSKETADVIGSLLANPQDTTALGARARDYVLESFAPATLYSLYHDLYREAVSRH
ncbi:MAG: glycosyltransferase family 4 protein, partial [Verrucomicrobiota bacterium]